MWTRLVAAFLGWIGLRAAMTLVLSVDDPNLRLAQELGFGPAVMVGTAVIAILAPIACVLVWRRRRIALPVALITLALYTAGSAAGLIQLQQHPAAAKRAYTAHREARGLPVNPERVAQMFSPAGQRILWLTLGVFSLAPVALLLWRREEFTA